MALLPTLILGAPLPEGALLAPETKSWGARAALGVGGSLFLSLSSFAVLLYMSHGQECALSSPAWRGTKVALPWGTLDAQSHWALRHTFSGAAGSRLETP